MGRQQPSSRGKLNALHLINEKIEVQRRLSSLTKKKIVMNSK